MKSLNPTCKLIGLVVPTLLLAGLHHPAVNLAVFAVCLAALLLSRANVRVLAGTLAPVLLVAVGMFSTGYHFHAGAGMPINAAAQALTGAAVWNGLVLGSRVLAFAGLGLLFVLTTDRILLVRSLQQQLRLPPVFAYGLLAAWGILPNMMEEYKRTRAAFAARGIRVFPVSPALLPNDVSAENFTYDYTLETRSVEAPVEQGQVLGTITAYFNGRSYGTLDLVATCSVERDPWLYRLDRIQKFFDNLLVRILLVVVLVVIAALLLRVMFFRSRGRTGRRGYAYSGRGRYTGSRRRRG